MFTVNVDVWKKPDDNGLCDFLTVRITERDLYDIAVEEVCKNHGWKEDEVYNTEIKNLTV